MNRDPDALISIGVDVVTQGKGFWFTEIVGVAGVYTGARLQNKDPLTASITVGIGTAGDKIITYGNKLNLIVSNRSAKSVGTVTQKPRLLKWRTK